MINFSFNSTREFTGRPPTDYPDILNFEGIFSIEIDNKPYFFEPHFSVFEFLMFTNKWINNIDKTKNMLFNCIDTEDNPLISFINRNGKWHIYSPWQLFECNTAFSREELVAAITQLKKSMGI